MKRFVMHFPSWTIFKIAPTKKEKNAEKTITIGTSVSQIIIIMEKNSPVTYILLWNFKGF